MLAALNNTQVEPEWPGMESNSQPELLFHSTSIGLCHILSCLLSLSLGE